MKVLKATDTSRVPSLCHALKSLFPTVFPTLYFISLASSSMSSEPWIRVIQMSHLGPDIESLFIIYTLTCYNSLQSLMATAK